MSERKSANAYRTISEVAGSLGVPQHVLRFWETKFPAVKPLKRGGNRRYYRPEDIEVLQVIHKLLHVDGYTIKGAQKLLKERGVRALVEELLAAEAPETSTPETSTLEAAEAGVEAAAEAEVEAEAEVALAEAGIPEALTVDPEAVAVEVPGAMASAELEAAVFGVGGAGETPVAAMVAPEASGQARQVQEREAQERKARLVAELKSIRAQLAEALGGAATSSA